MTSIVAIANSSTGRNSDLSTAYSDNYKPTEFRSGSTSAQDRQARRYQPPHFRASCLRQRRVYPIFWPDGTRMGTSEYHFFDSYCAIHYTTCRISVSKRTMAVGTELRGGGATVTPTPLHLDWLMSPDPSASANPSVLKFELNHKSADARPEDRKLQSIFFDVTMYVLRDSRDSLFSGYCHSHVD